MKLLKYLLSAILIVATIWSCTDEDFGSLDFLSTANAPTNVAAQFNATQDNTGTVTITPNAEAAVSYEVYFEESTTEPVKVKQGSSVTHVYAEGNYIVKLVAIGITGLKTEITLPLVVSFLAPQNLEVTWSKDEATSNKVNVIAKADLGISYDVYFGEVGNDVPVTANMGETASYIYAEPGTYTIKVVAKSAGPDTTEEILDVEATKIAAPIAKAPTPKSRADADVVSIFSDKYTNIAVNQWNPLDWGQSTVLSDFDVDGDNILKYDFLNWTGIVTDYDNPTDLSAMEYVHFDYWTNEATELNLELVNTSYPDGDPLKISKVTTPISTFGEWVSVDIPLTDFTTDMSGITQIVLSSTGKTVFIDNIYFYKAPSVTIAGALPINFEYPFTLSSFDGGAISVVDNPDTNGNSSANVAKLIKDAGQVWAGSKITVDTPFELSESMTVTAKVWSPRVGLKLLMKFEDAIPWPGNSETGASTATTTVANAWEELTFTITGVDASLEYYNLVLIMDDGTMGDGSSDFTIYVDDISVASFLDFEPNFALSSFDGGAISVVDNPDTNGNSSANVAQLIKDAGQVWAGSKITVDTPFELSESMTVTAKVWSPRVGLKLLMKFEDAIPWPGNSETGASTATTTVANAWEELTFTITGVDASLEYYNLVLIMDDGTMGDGSSDFTIYVDDIAKQ